MRYALPLYVAGIALSIGAATLTLATGWAAVVTLVVGVAVFALGIVFEERSHPASELD